MKILFFTMTMSMHGAERVINTLCNNWLGKNDDLIILTCIQSKSQYKFNKSIKIQSLISENKYCYKGKIKTFGEICKLYENKIKNFNPDIIVSFLPEPCIIASLYRKKLGIPVIGSERSNPYYQYKNIIIKKIVNHFYCKLDGFVFQTEGARLFFDKKIYSKSAIIGNPIDNKVFEGLNWTPNENEVVSVGRFTVEKNYPLLVKAFSRVHKQIPKAYLKIYGKIDDSIGLEKIISDLELRECVFLMGESDHIQEEIRKANVYVLSSKSEGMPNSLMEAMSLGLPVVATDCPSGGPRQLIKNRSNGILVDNEDYKALADAIILLLKDFDFAKRLGEEAKKIGVEYGINSICTQWKDYIYNIISEGEKRK